MGNTKDKKKPKNRPSLTVSKDGPYFVKDLNKIENSKGESIPSKPFMALCRCGHSSHKPFCDGMHAAIGFSGKKMRNRPRDINDNYKGTGITIHDNRCVCAHRGHCTDNLPKVFNVKQKPWINPDAEDPEEEARVIERCPSQGPQPRF